VTGERSASAASWLAIGVAAFCSMVSLRVCDPLLSRFAAEFHAGLADVAWTVSGYALAYGAMQVAFGPLGDRYGKPRVMVTATVLACACNLAVAASPTLATVIASRVAAGAAAGGIIPLAIAHVGDSVPIERRQHALARLMYATLGGMVFGQWLGGQMGGTPRWRWLFVGLAAVFGACAVAVHRSRSREVGGGEVGVVPARTGGRERAAGSSSDLLQVLRIPHVRGVMAATALEGALAFSLLTFVPARLQLSHHLTTAEAGAGVALFGVGGLVFAASARIWLRRWSTRVLVGVGSGCVGACALAMALSDALAPVLVLSVVGGFGLYMLHSTLQTLATQMAPERRGAGIGLFAASLFIGQAAGVAAGALAMQHGFATATFLVAAVGVPALGQWIGRLAGGDWARRAGS
jgi:predicted MFS family arabinose efflux permease